MEIMSKEDSRKLAGYSTKEDSFHVDVEFKGNEFFSYATFITSLCSYQKFRKHRTWKKIEEEKEMGSLQ